MEQGSGVVIGAANTLFAESLRSVLARTGWDVIAAVPDATALRTAVGAVPADRPHLCLVDGRLLHGTHLADLVAGYPQCRVIVLTGDHDPGALLTVISAGARGYVHISRGLDVLLDVMERVLRGETVVEGTFVRPDDDVDADTQHVRRLAEFLTQRERECLTLLVAGLDTAAMSARLGVSRTTVRSHVQAVLAKLGVHSRLEAASVAVRHGLVPGQALPAGSGPTRRD